MTRNEKPEGETARGRVLKKLEEFGISPKRSLGQNFLVSDQVIEKILRTVTLLKPKHLIEIGPGLGALTEGLNRFAQQNHIPFDLVELDRNFAEHWRQAGLNVHEIDALDFDWTRVGSDYVLVSNLPYQISSRIVVDRSCELGGASAMVLMFQKEVAERIVAKPGGKDYGLLSVIAQTFWDVSLVTNAGSGDFFPAPQVGSRVLRFVRRTNPDFLKTTNLCLEFLSFVKAAFAQRRKLMTKNLSGYRSDVDWVDWLRQINMRTDARAEILSVMDYLNLFKKICELNLLRHE